MKNEEIQMRYFRKLLKKSLRSQFHLPTEESREIRPFYRTVGIAEIAGRHRDLFGPQPAY